MPKVYVINKSAHDFSKAEKFGTLHFLSRGAMSKYATNRIFRQFEEELVGATDEDYILLTSLTVMNVIACVMFALRFKKLNLLLLKDDDYVARKLDLSEV